MSYPYFRRDMFKTKNEAIIQEMEGHLDYLKKVNPPDRFKDHVRELITYWEVRIEDTREKLYRYAK